MINDKWGPIGKNGQVVSTFSVKGHRQRLRDGKVAGTNGNQEQKTYVAKK